MTSVFIGGSRRISRLNSDIRSRIDRISSEGYSVLVGDANGADKAVQRYLFEKGWTNVEVFCSGKECRNNIGHWPVTFVPVPKQTKDLDYYSAKDRAMAEAATGGIMIWDGNSVGTLLNAARLLDRRKPVDIYLAPERSFLTLKSKHEFEHLVGEHASHLRAKLQRQMRKEGRKGRLDAQPSLF